MDIKHLYYFVEIVQSQFNLSLAAQKLHISQPALSQVIKNFEIEEDFYLFERYKGRLQNLTPAGERFYLNAQNVLTQYENMLTELREDSIQFKGKIRIGIPPLILGLVFAELMATMIVDNPEIEFEIVETGAYDLSRMLTLQELDFAVLLQPTNIDPTIVTEHVLQEDELTAFMSSENPLAKNKELEWHQLHQKPMAIFNNTFMIHHKLKERFKNEEITPKISMMSASWDFLLLATHHSDVLTILPAPVRNFSNLDSIREVPFKEPITWKVVLCQPKKERYRHVDNHVLDSILTYFDKNKKTTR